jgi:hypothetical protein
MHPMTIMMGMDDNLSPSVKSFIPTAVILIIVGWGSSCPNWHGSTSSCVSQPSLSEHTPCNNRCDPAPIAMDWDIFPNTYLASNWTDTHTSVSILVSCGAYFDRNSAKDARTQPVESLTQIIGDNRRIVISPLQAVFYVKP